MVVRPNQPIADVTAPFFQMQHFTAPNKLGGCKTAVSTPQAPAQMRDMTSLLEAMLVAPLQAPPCQLSLEDLRQLQAEEREALEAIYGPDCELHPPGLIRIRIRPRGAENSSAGPVFAKPTEERMHRRVLERIALWLIVGLGERYPESPPLIELENWGALSRDSEDALYDALLEAANRNLGGPVVHTLAEEAIDFLTRLQTSPPEDLSLDSERTDTEETEADDVSLAADDVNMTSLWTSDLNPLRPSAHVGGVSEVLACLPPGIGVLNVENVLRRDLWQAFERKREEFRAKFANREAEMTTPVRLFHGTSAGSVPNIVRQGLLVPGESNGVTVQNGSSHGKGIYLSPDPSFSLSYCRDDWGGRGWGGWGDTTHSGRLLVCAVLPGKKFPEKDWDTMVANNGLEWVFFDPSQVLPCYVVHFHWRQEVGVAYHSVTGGGALVRVVRKSQEEVSADVAKLEQVAREEAEAAAKKRAEFYFGRTVKVLDWAVPEDDDDTDCQMAFRSASTSYLGEDGDQNMCTGEYQQERFEPVVTAVQPRGVEGTKKVTKAKKKRAKGRL